MLSSFFYIFWGLLLIPFLKLNTRFHLPSSFSQTICQGSETAFRSSGMNGTSLCWHHPEWCISALSLFRPSSASLSWWVRLSSSPAEVAQRQGCSLHTRPVGETSAVLRAPVSMDGGGRGSITTMGSEEGWGTHQRCHPRAPRAPSKLQVQLTLLSPCKQAWSQAPSRRVPVFPHTEGCLSLSDRVLLLLRRMVLWCCWRRTPSQFQTNRLNSDE